MRQLIEHPLCIVRYVRGQGRQIYQEATKIPSHPKRCPKPQGRSKAPKAIKNQSTLKATETNDKTIDSANEEPSLDLSYYQSWYEPEGDEVPLNKKTRKKKEFQESRTPAKPQRIKPIPFQEVQELNSR
ncbi:hypothetical protein DSO57_1025833 [Entomophthora muscae]|uniref:Uncharacterized protein n=1 Tax=Entomophthora muscae TaxID=34485 RepID=A0ACC2RH05_9FUNG|nr:hypothetical protein DSO57_1025833 [Entomophthora muscae]